MNLGTLAGKSPITLIASCIYFVSCLSDDPKHAKEIAEIAGCSESTLKNAYRIMYEVRTDVSKGLNMLHPIERLPIA